MARKKIDLGLNVVRGSRWSEKVSNSNRPVEVCSLPPTSDAAKYHSYRVYLQTQIWMGNTSDRLNPTDWGWKHMDNEYHPVKMDSLPAPDSLLMVIRCKCSTDCASKKCTCRKYGLECTSGCGECRGVACTNSHIIGDNIDVDEMEDIFE